MNTKDIKAILYNRCESILDEKMEQIKSRLESIQESKTRETKSSAGDKFETGRAMMQIEEDKSNAQMGNILESYATLKGVKLDTSTSIISVGSLVVTDQANYFISIGTGKIIWDNTTYYCISKEAPVGRLLMGKAIGESVTFNGKQILIQSIL